MRRKSIVLIAALLLLVFAGTAWANFTEPTIISTTDNLPYKFNFSAEIVEGVDGRLHAFWASNSYNDPEPTYVEYSYSDDGGKSWTVPLKIDERYDFWRLFEGPKCVIDSNGVFHLTFHYINYLVRISNSKYARSADNGQNWTTVLSPRWGGYNRNGNIALDPAGSVFIAWDLWTSGGYSPNEVFLRSSIDSGLTWPSYWSVHSPAMLITNRRAEARSLLIDASGLMHLLITIPGTSDNYSATTYLVSSDGGYTWQERTNIPAGFLMGGIYQYGNEILIPGSDSGNAAFIRSRDGGLTWEGPFTIAGQGHVNQIVSDGGNNYHVFFGNAYYASTDGGATWSGPDYMGSGTMSKILLTRSGDLLAIGTFGNQVGLIKHKPSYEVRAPEYLSLWEKSSFVYSFEVRGTGDVQVNLPAEYIEVGATPEVTIGGQQVPASTSSTGDRIVATFPVSSLDWTSVSLTMTVKKGIMKKVDSIQARIEDLTAELEIAVSSENGERADQIDRDLHYLDQELFAVLNEFIVSIQAGGNEAATDLTSVSIYEDLVSVYSHFKANPKQPGVDLLLLTDETISVAKGEPFMLDVKVTHLQQGQVASTSISGNFGMLDVIETNSTGTRKTDFYVFYPPDTQATSETITISVTVDTVTSSVPIQVNLR